MNNDELKRLEQAFQDLQEHRNRERKPKKKRSRLKPVSDKRKDEDAKYRRDSKAWLRGKTCCLCGIGYSLSVHHVKGRGKFLNDQSTWEPACLVNDRIQLLKQRFPEANFSYPGGCHGFIEANKKLARKLGLLKT